MSKKNMTRRALFASVISLILCCAMLVGTTFAWFTDSVTSASNVITSGNLDIEVEYTLDGENWKPLDGANDLFQKDLWEPGHTEVVALRVINKGSLALKYTANMNIVNEVTGKNKNGEDFNLSDYLTVSTLTQQANDEAGIGDIALMLAFSGENSVAYESTVAFNAGNVLRDSQELHPGDEHYMIIKVDMPETVGNEANHNGVNIPEIKFGIDFNATQFSYENDTFGNQYDANANYENPADSGYQVVYIYDINDFAAFGKAINNNTAYGGVNVANNASVWVELMADIDMTNAPDIQGGQFAIGNGNNLMFSGVFDGNNHVITNYNIEGAWTYNVSLFRTVGAGFVMRDITFDNCSATKTNNRGTALIVGTYGANAALTFDNVDIKNSTVNGYSQVGAYVGTVTEGAVNFIDCDANAVTLTATSDSAEVGVFLCRGYSHHDYETSGLWITNCTMTGCKAIVNGVELDTVNEHNYVK